MIDLHTHSLLSDGRLLPAELIQRAAAAGYRGLAITDHVDSGTLGPTIEQTAAVCSTFRRALKGSVVPIPGVEITHVPPATIPDLAARARTLGAKLVVAHGETVVEPVPRGTDRAAIDGGVDLLAHPGLIEPEDVLIAKERGVYLEISGRRGHCLTNGHLVRLARELGALDLLVISSDAHAPEDLFSAERQRSVGLGAGLSPDELAGVLRNMERLLGAIA